MVDKLQEFAARLPKFTFACCVADEGSAHPNKGYVTALHRARAPERRRRGRLSVRPAAMVDAVRNP